jgi:trigger factor
MNITFDKQSNTFAKLNINLSEEDYQPSVEKKLKDYRKKASIKGFRPGMVPLEMIKKMYGKGILIEEINHKLSHTVSDYIKENELQIVGDPMPTMKDGESIDWDVQKSFDFSYDLGLSGDFEVDFAKIKPIDRYEIKAGTKELNETIENLKNQFSEQTHPETVEDGDMIFGVFTLGDWTEKSAIPMKAVKETEKALFIGSKIGDTLNFDIQNVFVDQKSLELATGKKGEAASELVGSTQFLIEDITRSGKSELNQEFFDKVLGKDKTTDEVSFREQVLTIIEGNYKRESDYLLKIDSEKALLEEIEIELPDEFLKKWLIEVNQGKFTAEQVDRDFEFVKKDLRWQLIKNKIAKQAEIKVEYADVLEKTKEMVRGQFGMYDGGMDEIIEKVATNYLTEKTSQDGENRFQQMFKNVFEDKISEAIISKIAVNNKLIDVEEFKAIAEKLQPKEEEHDHDHGHNHDHAHDHSHSH